MFESVTRKFLQQLPAETAHDMAIKLLGSPLAGLSGHRRIDNPVELMGIEFPNPVGLAAGFDKNADVISGLAHQGFGFIEVGTITPRPQAGNPKPRIFRLPEQQAIINRLGFNNKGLDHLIKQVKKHKFPGVLGINIGKNKDTDNSSAFDDYSTCFKQAHMLADYITINISSPNTPDLRDLQEIEVLRDLLSRMHRLQQECADADGKFTPIVVKIAPDQANDQTKYMTETIVDSGMNGIICTNTTISRDSLGDHPLKSESGGLSGKPLLELSNEVLKTVRDAAGPKFPIIAVGGITCAKDALQKFELGADLIQLYTGFIYHGHHLIRDINQKIRHARTR